MEAPPRNSNTVPKKISVQLSTEDVLSLILSRLDRFEQKLDRIEQKLDNFLSKKAPVEQKGIDLPKAKPAAVKQAKPAAVKQAKPAAVKQANQPNPGSIMQIFNGIHGLPAEVPDPEDEMGQSMYTLGREMRANYPGGALNFPPEEEDIDDLLLGNQDETSNIRLARLFEEKSKEYNFFDKEFNASVEASHIYEMIEAFGTKEGVEIPIWDLDFLALSTSHREFAGQLHLMAQIIEDPGSNLSDQELFKAFGEERKSREKTRETINGIMGRLDINSLMKTLMPDSNLTIPPDTNNILQSLGGFMGAMMAEKPDRAMLTLIPRLTKFQNQTFAELVQSEELFKSLKDLSTKSSFSLLLDFKSYETRPILDIVKYAALLSYLQEKCSTVDIVRRSKIYLLLLRLAAGKPLPDGLIYEETEAFFEKFMVAAAK
jgi:hypothetical protein